MFDRPPDTVRTVQITDAEWERLEAEAADKDAISKSVAWTREWNPKFNLLGVVGEHVFATLVGAERQAKFGDGGRDFGDIDVKASSRFDAPLLLRLASDRFAAALYALVAVDLDRRRGRYVGFATRDEFRAAPTVEYGHGPTRTLRPDDLHGGVPMESPYLSERPTGECLWYAERGRQLRLEPNAVRLPL